VITAPFHSNRSYSIAAYVFVAAGICLPSRCLAMNVYSNFTLPAFGRHVTIYFDIPKSVKISELCDYDDYDEITMFGDSLKPRQLACSVLIVDNEIHIGTNLARPNKQII
jgi:hypothetical protein